MREGALELEAPCSTRLQLSDFVKIRTIGHGSFGEAVLVRHRHSGHMAVLKRVNVEASSVESTSAAESAAREAQVLQRLRHPHIVEFLGAFVDSSRDPTGGTLCLLMAFCEGGDLQKRLQRLRQEKRVMTEVVVLRLFDQLCSAVAYFHERHVLHRDLKPSNIFIKSGSAHDREEDESVAIGDFGVSRPLAHAKELVTTMVGTPCYLSPEVCRGKPYSYKSDIWSLGCVLFEMIALRPPFSSTLNLEALVTKIVQANFALPKNGAADFPEASRCARAMLRVEQEKRPSAHQLLSRPRVRPIAVSEDFEKTGDRMKVVRGRCHQSAVGGSASQALSARSSAPGTPSVGSAAALSPRVGGRAKQERDFAVQAWPSDHSAELQFDRPELLPMSSQQRQSQVQLPLPSSGPWGVVRRRSGGGSEEIHRKVLVDPLAANLRRNRAPNSDGNEWSPRLSSNSCRSGETVLSEGNTAGTSDRSGSPMDGSPHETDDPKLRKRQETRKQQSQAFRQWLQQQRSAREQPKVKTDSCDTGAAFVAPVSGGHESVSAQSTWDPPAPQLEDFDAEPTMQASITARDSAEEKLTARLEAVWATASTRCPAYQGHFSTPPDSTGATPTTSSASACAASSGSTGTVQARCCAPAEAMSAALEDRDVKEMPSELPSVLPMEASVSIGDRIEGIRACLEARLGIHRFQLLYQALVRDEGIMAMFAKSRGPLPKEVAAVLPEGLSELWQNGDTGSDDLSTLIPLVAKLVACEQSYFS